MANWTNSKPQGATQRKKWNLDDKTSLRNLKYRIAEDGCSSTQYDLARQLLEDSSESDSPNSYSQGVHWLMQAADQGHEDALILLNECYQTRRGINDHNECEVQTFLAMSPGERAARKAARELFACLSNGDEYITAAQLERKMREIYKIQKKKRKLSDEELDDTEPDLLSNGHMSPSPSRHRRTDLCNNAEVITEARLVSAAADYANGFMPNINQALTLSMPHPRTLDHIPCFHRLLFHPLKSISLCYHRFIRALSSFPESLRYHLQFLFILFIYAFFASENLLLFVPLGLYYISLTVMIISTFKMIKCKHDFIDFRMWSGLFLSYGDHNVDADGSENQFLRNNMKPYLYYFVGFFANVMLYPIISDQWMPHSEITMVSFVLVFVTMATFMYSSYRPVPDLLILVSFGINVLAKYPYEMDTVVLNGWRFLDLKIPNFPSFVIGNGIEFCLNCRALLYLLIPGFLILLARRRNWHGTYQYLIPHCVTLSWLQICIISSECATMFGLVRAALGLAGLLLFLPLFGMVTLMVPVFAAVEWLSLTDPTVRLVASILTTVFVIIGSCLMAANNRTEKYVTFLQITSCGLATVFLTLPYMTSNFESSHTKSNIFHPLINEQSTFNGPNEQLLKLTWDQYYKYCHQPAWEHVNSITAQLRCSELDGTRIHWEGIVSHIDISRVRNIRAHLIYNYLPKFCAEMIACWYGEKNIANCGTQEQCDEISAFIDEQKKCNLNNWNTYEYEITVRMNAGGILSRQPEIILKASHEFSNFTLLLNATDRIWFKGILKNVYDTGGRGGKVYMSLGKPLPRITLTGSGCVNCHSKDIVSFQMVEGPTVNGRVKDLYRGVKYLLNVLFNPLVTFK